MSNPYNTDEYMTYIVKRTENLPFNPKLKADDEELQLCAASVYHENNLSARVTSLLQRILMDHDEIDFRYLNSIGFSKEDASQLSMEIHGLESVNPPSNWQDEL
ncbi:hypothetical protein MYOV065v1_p0014 [Vibrio phage PS15B.2]|nr:hypothetical protein MYOV065v1_p0014 [Vibrio phage PS15B.2]QZI90864.1 hypothetical protein MYOV064v1_p0014 [Vibrio phage PS15B.4]